MLSRTRVRAVEKVARMSYELVAGSAEEPVLARPFGIRPRVRDIAG